MLRRTPTRRPAAVLPTTCILLVALLAMLAFAIDLGILCIGRTEVQRTADAASLAADQELVPSARPAFPLKSPVTVHANVPPALAVTLGKDMSLDLTAYSHDIAIIAPEKPRQDLSAVLPSAKNYAARQPHLQDNGFTLLDEDVAVFRHTGETVVDPGPIPILPRVNELLMKTILRAPDDSAFNAVRVKARKDHRANGPLKLSFASFLGVSHGSVEASSDAAMLKGYGIMADAKMLPFAMDITVWRALRLGNGTVNGIPLVQALLPAPGPPIILLDENRWSPETRTVVSGSDQIWEALLLTNVQYLSSGILVPPTPLPVALVTLNLSGSNAQPDVATLEKQIKEGPNATQVPGKLYLPFERYGFPHVNPALNDELESIIGQPRLIPLYETLPSTVNNTLNALLGRDQKYKITGFGGVVVTEVRTIAGGLVRYIKIQPAPFVSSKVLPAKPGQLPSYSDCVWTAPMLIK